MRAADVMTPDPVCISPDTSIIDAARLMLERKFSGLPVVDAGGRLVGIVTEGDLLRRTETGTQPKRARWIEFLMGSGRLATEYAQTRGRKVSDVMTPEVQRVTEDALLEEVVHLMGRHQINRVLVVRDGKLVGIVTRANLLHALASVAAETKPGPTSDTSIRERLYAELKAQPWAPVGLINVVVRNGVVHLSGTLLDERHRGAIRVAAERIPGVKAVEDRLVWVDPVSGMVVPAFEQTTAPPGKAS
ncbi:CBS domain-containing protein [Bradyrhizobium sp.]|jgi:CBS domain-containing protein|uniref:CBS domain-containing protein n=1 Tax=Bradyrhizobium sp. TaxID=376 RepID=UPI003C75AB69